MTTGGAETATQPPHRKPSPTGPGPLLRRIGRLAAAPALWLWRHQLAVVTLGFLLLFVAAVLGLIVADLWYLIGQAPAEPGRTPSMGQYLQHAAGRLSELFSGLFRSEQIRAAMWLSAYTSGVTLLLVMLSCVPIGYALSRYRFPGQAVADTIVDLPIVLPPVVVGLSLLVVFTTSTGRWIEGLMVARGWSRYGATGIILCQFIISAPFAIRSAKTAFDDVDVRLEELARTLGCTRARAFWTVALPLARQGIAAGCIMAWARAVGLFGPLLVFVGCVRMKSEILPTTIYLEVSTGGIEVALAVAMIMIGLAGAALVAIHALIGGRRGWKYD